MKKFEILRYLKRFSFLIFLLSLAGSLLIYLYADNKQAYTASVVIKYTNSGVADGYAPDGSKLDVNEIYSSAVISQAMDALGASGKLSNIRSNVTVTPIIPDDQQKINDALIEKGEEITYFPNTYRVSLVVSGKQGANYARNMLDAILQSYCTYYTEKYVEQKLSLNPSSHLLENGYDYYECIRILENDTNDMQNFLLAKREHYPDFRSSKTGYTYADLCAIYSSFKKYTIPELYAQVLSGPQIRDGTVLQQFLANSIADSNQTEQVDTGRRTSIEQLIDEYVQKNAGILESYFTEGGDNVSSNYILGNIEQAGAGDKAQTTYDGLILELVDIDKKIAANQIDREFLSEILTNFQNVDFGGTSEEHTRMEQMINDYEAQLQKYYEIVNVSSKELNLYISADYLKMMSSVRVAPSINAKPLARDFAAELLRTEITEAAQAQTGNIKDSSKSLEAHYLILNHLLDTNKYDSTETDCSIQLINTGSDKKEKWEIQRTSSLEDELVGGLIANLADPDILSPEDTLTVYLDTLQKLNLKEMTSYLGVVNIMNTSDTAKNSIASALAEQIHKNFNYVIKSSSENGYNATVTTEITTFDSDSILADYQEKLDKYLASAEAVIDGSQKRYEKSFEILLNSINDNTVTTVNDVDFVLINDGVSWKLQDEGNTLGSV